MIDEIRKRDAAAEHVVPATHYSHTWGLHLPSVQDRRHLLKMVDALAGGAGQFSMCPVDLMEPADLGDWCDWTEDGCGADAEKIKRCWLRWADAQARGEG
jgi:hypothetical protein